ncbi:dihydrolipoyl dehydrogenase family protein [Kitasatospora hibisci]|uniref:dihydrolipoyl dehydrogenase family protein n=1 Tax=Kitasatospora hibisci TaxID=3369522 RepID=UPI0037552C46
MTWRGRFDLVVVGGGSAGLTAARLAADLGARVALIERDRLGGDCLWTGCVPSKTLLHAAADIHTIRRANRYGFEPSTGPVDWRAVKERVRAAIAAIEPHDSAQALARLGVEVVTGSGRFTGRRRIEAAGRRLPFHRALIATGSRPVLPPVPGLAQAWALTTDSVWELDELPHRLLVVGGGASGCELGQAFARLGSRVTLVEAERGLLPAMDPMAGDLLARRLTAEGVRVHTGAKLRSVRPGEADLATADGAAVTVAFDALLVATGRRPSTDGLGLDAAGVRTDRRGLIATDARLRTANSRIHAAGDVAGPMPFTHVAAVQAADAVLGGLLGVPRRRDYRAVPYTVFTDPEIAQVGAAGSGERTRLLRHDGVDRAVTEDATDGFTRLVLDARGRITGATVAGPRAGEVIVELAHAVRAGWTPRRLAATVHPYPTYADGPWLAAFEEIRHSRNTPRARAVTRAVLRLRRWMPR